MIRKGKLAKLLDNLGIKKKLILVSILFAAVPFIIINIFSFSQSSELITNMIAQTSANQLIKTNEEIDKEINTIKNNLFKLRWDTDFLQNLVREDGQKHTQVVENGKTIDMLEHCIEENNLDSIYIYTHNNTFSLQQTDEFDRTANVKGEQWFKDALNMKDDPIVMTKIHKDKQGMIKSKNVVSFVLQITKQTDQGEFRAAMVCNKLLSDWILQYYGRPYDETVLVLDYSGERLFTMNNKLRVDNTWEIFPAEVMTKDEGYCLNDFYGKKYLTVWKPSSIAQIKVIKTIPHDSLMQSLNRISTMSNLAFIIIFIASLCMIHLLSRSIIQPIESLKRSMEGNETGQINLTLRKDEIGDLARSYYAMLQAQKEMTMEIRRTNKKKIQMELNLLNAQINPHFLYNTINTIRSLAMIQGNKTVAESLKALSNLLHSSVQIGRNFITIGEELKQIENYIEIQKLRYMDMFDIHFDIGEGVREKYTITFLLQPIVENAIFHGIENTEGYGKINVSIHEEEGNIIYRVTDNGAGISKDALDNLNSRIDQDAFPSGKEHIGLKNINDRLELFFGIKRPIKIYSKLGQGTTIVVTIPAITDIREIDNDDQSIDS